MEKGKNERLEHVRIQLISEKEITSEIILLIEKNALIREGAECVAKMPTKNQD